MSEELLRRTGGSDWIPYWEAARKRELRFQRCRHCLQWRFQPGPMCPSCLSMESEWALASGRARLVSWVVVRPPVLPAWKDRTPYPTEPVGWIVEQAGPEICLFSSDWPHVEGGRNPVKRFEESMAGLGEAVKQRFYCDNFVDLMGAGLPA